jgi:hypothetical protein
MPAQVDMVNEALQKLGTRTTVTAAQLAANTGSNEAIQANIIYDRTRKRLLRMAPWNCAFNTANLTLITAAPGTPENVSAAPQLWGKGQPAPPWAYEYQRPRDCLYAAWVTPNTATGFAGGIPITTAVTGGSPSFWQGPPVKFKLGIDQFYVASAAAIVAGGTGYAVGDQIVVASQIAAAVLNNILGNFQISAPQGAQPVLQVTTVGGGGVITGVALVGVTANVAGVQTTVSGALYYPHATQPVTQGSTTGAGSGATFTLTYTVPVDQNVILTNQEFAMLNYIRDVTDVNLFDDLFTNAFTSILGASLNMALAGDKKLSNMLIALANDDIGKARGRDGNEGLTVNDVTPDWIRVRGVTFVEDYSGPFDTGYNWGNIWPGYT